MSYELDRRWSDRFIPAIKQIVGPYLLEESSFYVDANQAADLVILNARDKKIAARVRRHGYAEKYGYEFTIRAHRSSGAKTEMEKIVDGFGDWMLYGHSCSEERTLDRWLLIDLAALRAALIRQNARYETRKNTDGTTGFVAFDVRNLPENVVIASSHKIEIRNAA